MLSLPRALGWFWLATMLAALAISGPARLRATDPAPIDFAANRVSAALAESVRDVLREAPQDERGLVMATTLLDDQTVRKIQQTPDASRVFIDRVAARYPLTQETRHFLTGAFIGFSLICADFPPIPADTADTQLLKLITALRQGVNAGVAGHHAGQ